MSPHPNRSRRLANRQPAPAHSGGLREALTGEERELLAKVLRWHQQDTIHYDEATMCNRLLRRLRAPAIDITA